MFALQHHEIQETLAEELEDSVTDLSDSFAQSLDPDPEKSAAAWSDYAATTRRLAVAAEILGIEGVKDIINFVEQNVAALSAGNDGSGNAESRLDLFASWPLLLSAHLRDSEDMELVGELLTQLQLPEWPLPMPEERATAVLEKLLGGLEAALPESEEAGEVDVLSARSDVRHIHHEDLSLDFPDDINPNLVDAFLHEVPLRITDLSEIVQRLSRGQARDDDIVTAQRIAHTIKGSANIAGVKGAAAITHAMEDILQHLAEQRSEPERALNDLLMDTCDCLASMLEYMQDLGERPSNVSELLVSLDDWAKRLIRETKIPAPEAMRPENAMPVEEAANELERVGNVSAWEQPEEPIEIETEQSEAAAPEAEVAEAPQQADAVAARDKGQAGEAPASVSRSLRMATERVDELLRYAGEVSISTVQLRGLHSRLDRQLAEVEKQFELVKERMDDLQELIAVKGIPSTRSGLAVVGGETEGFDPLEMDQYSELHSASNALLETVTDASEMTEVLRKELGRFDNLLIDQDRVSKVLSDVVLSARMLPMESIVPRLQRTVRQTARMLNKEVELHIQGSEILIDSEVLNRLADPLIHVLRNAIDHGIEDPAERRAVNKPPLGEITLRFSREGDDILVECHDDGRGFDFEKIQDIAIQRGLMNYGQDISEDELARMTLLPGFSTRTATTQVSGRGIGMNMLYREVIEQRGTVHIDSTPGRGTTVLCRLPLTLVSMHVLLVETQGRVFGIPSSTLEQMLYSDAGQIRFEGADQVFTLENVRYLVDSLARLLGMELSDTRHRIRGVQPLLLVRADGAALALSFDRALDSGYLVVKNLGEYVQRLPGVIGGAILADGSIAPILDLRDLIRLGGSALPFPAHLLEQSTSVVGLSNVLVVDDSLSARRTLSQLVEDAGYAARTAIDGIDAIDEIEKEKPDAILLDMEMPRMTGLELTRHLRAHAETAEIPIIMITSRSTEKHRLQASSAGVDLFVTKPYREDELVTDLRRLISLNTATSSADSVPV